MDHFTFDPRLDGIGGKGRGPPHIFPNRAPTFVNPALLETKTLVSRTTSLTRCLFNSNIYDKTKIQMVTTHLNNAPLPLYNAGTSDVSKTVPFQCFI